MLWEIIWSPEFMGSLAGHTTHKLIAMTYLNSILAQSVEEWLKWN